jgi:hypothetical protein
MDSGILRNVHGKTGRPPRLEVGLGFDRGFLHSHPRTSEARRAATPVTLSPRTSHQGLGRRRAALGLTRLLIKLDGGCRRWSGRVIGNTRNALKPVEKTSHAINAHHSTPGSWSVRIDLASPTPTEASRLPDVHGQVVRFRVNFLPPMRGLGRNDQDIALRQPMALAAGDARLVG